MKTRNLQSTARRWGGLAALLGALAGLGACAAPLSDHEREAEWRRAEVASRDGDWALAADLWNRLRHDSYGIESRPHHETAAALAELGQREDALALLDRALDLFPGEPTLLASRGRLLAAMGFRRAAELDLLEATKQDPDDPVLWAALGEVQLALDEPRKAATALDRAISLDTAESRARRAAEGYSQTAVDLGRSDAFQLAARAQRELGSLGRAHELYAHAIELAEAPSADLLVEGASLHTDRPEDAPECPLLHEALGWVRAASERSPQCPRAAFVLGCLLDRDGQLGEAIVAYRRAVEIDNLHLGALTNLAVAHARLGERARCASMVERALALETDDRRRAALLELVESAGSVASAGPNE